MKPIAMQSILTFLVILLATGTVVGQTVTDPEGAPGQSPAAPADGADIPMEESGFAVEVLASPAAEESSSPSLSAAGNSVILSWLEGFSGGEPSLRFASWRGAHFSLPGGVRSARDILAAPDDPPVVLPLADGRLVAQWVSKGASSTDIMLSVSTDLGARWSEPVRPHPGVPGAERAFASLLDLGDDGIGVLWLDGRALTGATGGATALYFNRLTAEGFVGEVLIDDRVCDCCPTAAVQCGERLVAFHRDRDEDEIRDISVNTAIEGKWTPSRTLHEDGWLMPGCPVNGPAAAARGDQVAVAWFALVENLPRVQVMFSTDGGETFEEPVRVDSGLPTGKPDLAWLPGGSVLVAWLEGRPGARTEIVMREVSPDGTMRQTVDLTTPRPAPSGRPQLAGVADGALVAWTEVNRKPTLVVAHVTRKEER